MGETTKIEWCNHTFNPWVGCTKVSSACDFCFAEGWAKRAGNPELWQGERRRTSATNWHQPIKWNRRAKANGKQARVFCASLADVFDNQVPARWRDDLWHLIDMTPYLHWLLLTKRPQNIAKMLPTKAIGVPEWGSGWKNVWLGVTAENQDEADRRIPILLKVPAAVHFVSYEPALGPVDFVRLDVSDGNTKSLNALTGDVWIPGNCGESSQTFRAARRRLDWIICGGESGSKARPMELAWARSARDQCKTADVAFFMKQIGGPSQRSMPGIPEDLNIRVFPR